MHTWLQRIKDNKHNREGGINKQGGRGNESEENGREGEREDQKRIKSKKKLRKKYNGLRRQNSDGPLNLLGLDFSTHYTRLKLVTAKVNSKSPYFKHESIDGGILEGNRWHEK